MEETHILQDGKNFKKYPNLIVSILLEIICIHKIITEDIKKELSKKKELLGIKNMIIEIKG